MITLVFLFSTQQSPDFLPMSPHAWSCLVSYCCCHCERGVCVCLVPCTSRGNTCWDKAWKIWKRESFFYSTHFISLVFILLVECKWIPLFFLLPVFILPVIYLHFYIKYYGACRVFICNCVFVCVLLLNINNIPVSLQFRNYAKLSQKSFHDPYPSHSPCNWFLNAGARGP